jgi:hypothetical protein
MPFSGIYNSIRDLQLVLLIKLVKKTHLINLQAEAMRLERLIHDVKLRDEDFTLYVSRFHDLVVALEGAGSNISEERIVHLFLTSLRDSPLHHAANRWLDQPGQLGYPESFEEVRNLMHLAWINQAHSSTLTQHPPKITFAAHAPPSTEKNRRFCIFCDKTNHSSEKCRSYRIDRGGGVPTLAKLGRDTQKKGHSGLATDKVSHSSFTVSYTTAQALQRIIVLDTGSTINILRDEDLFDTIRSCEESVVGWVEPSASTDERIIPLG